MNDILMQKLEFQTISNDEILDFSNEAKKFYEDNKNDIYKAKKELYDLSKINKKANSKYAQKNKIKINEYYRKLREKNKDNFFCHFCNRGYSDAPHYKIHCNSQKHQTNIEKSKQ